MKYLPFLDGKYSVAPGLVPVQKAQQAFDKLIFQVDDGYAACMENKLRCREENIHKYFCESELSDNTARAVNHYILNQLLAEYPDQFYFKNENNCFELQNTITGATVSWNDDWVTVNEKRYISLFDALCCQVQEDFAICQLTEYKDWMAAIHLCAPNHWAAEDKIGRSFDIVHAPVAGMEKTMPYYLKMLQTVILKGPFTRFAWGISTDKRLNHHPQAPPGVEATQWLGRSPDENTSEVFVRTERQNLIGFPELKAFLFTIRTYFYSIHDLSKEEIKALMTAVETMSDQSLIYKGLF
jgi:hypothetical protein